MERYTMAKGLCLSLAALALLAAAPAAAQQPGTQGTITATSRGRSGNGYLGMRLSARPAPTPGGAPRWADLPVVSGVEPGSPAAKVGLAAGDVLVAVNGVDARDPRTLFGQPGK